MPPETEEDSGSELQAIGIVIQSGKLSREEVGFGLRQFEPTPHLEGHQVGIGELPRGLSCTADSGCALPAHTCPHVLCVTFNAVQPTSIVADEYWDRGVIAEIGATIYTITPYFYYNGPGPDDWVAGVAIGGIASFYVEVPMTIADFFGQNHAIDLYIYTTATGQEAVVNAYGSSDSDTSITYPGVESIATLFIGSWFASNTEPIKICGIRLLANPETDEEDFIFPVNAFDHIVGVGQSISGNTVTITGDASGSRVGYRADLDPTYTFLCKGACCDTHSACTIKTEFECDDADGDFQGTNSECDPNPCPKGACCTDELCAKKCACSILSSDDCASYGGEYQGDDTVCSPNPCADPGPENCGGCCFGGFNGERGYKYQTISVEETIDGCTPGCSGSNSYYQTYFSDPDATCSGTCIDAGGTSTCTGTEGECACCGDTALDCSATYECGGFTGGCNSEIVTCFGLFDYAGLGWCLCDVAVDENIVNDSTKTFTCSDCSACAGSASYVITVTLFGICACQNE